MATALAVALTAVPQRRRTLAAQLLAGLAAPVRQTRSPLLLAGAGLRPSVVDAFGDQLVLHHVVPGRELCSRRMFEAALAAAARGAGHRVWLPPSATHPFDMLLDGRRVACKSESSSRTRADTVTISKLVTLCRVREQLRSAADPANTARRLVAERVLPAVGQCQLMLILRAFRESECLRYELLRVPTELFAGLPDAEALPMTRGGSVTLRVSDGVERQFDLCLDASDEKATVRNLPVRLCEQLACWRLPAGAAEAPET